MSRHIAGRGRTSGAPRRNEPPVDDVECSLDRKLTLGQFLKLANLIDSGSEAKVVIGEGLVSVNGEVDLRRSRGLADGDVVEVHGVRARVRAVGPDPSS